MGREIVYLAVFFAALLLLVKPLGGYMARVYEGEPTFLGRILGPLERLLYRLCGIRSDEEMTWRRYAFAMLAFNLLGALAVYGLQRVQGSLPLNPQGLCAVPPDLALNTAVSFATNTNWQSYGGETTLSYLTQMLGLGVQNFVSAASGMAVFAALARGFARRRSASIGNFWTDLTRTTLYILLPLALVVSLVLVWQGAVQTFRAAETVSVLDPSGGAKSQVLPLGPAASQIAIKQLGTNGGGFFNANSAHPFENPTPFTNFLETLSILGIAAALCFTFGKMVKDTRQGWAILAVMMALFVVPLVVCWLCERTVPPGYAPLGVDGASGPLQCGGNMEGKEARFGVASSALWATATTAASNGSVNAMHDSFTPLGGLVPMWMMQLGEVVFGGVGSGLYGMLVFAVVTVFVAGLMVGRTPEYLGKKIEPFEMKMAAIAILVPAALVLVGTAVAVLAPPGRSVTNNPGAHGFSEILYAFSSTSNNNGSAFGGLGTNNLFYNVALSLCMFLGRYWIAVPVLAMAGSLAGKRAIPVSEGTLRTHTPLFATFLAATVVVVGALTFLPALALGPIVEQLQMGGALGK